MKPVEIIAFLVLCLFQACTNDADEEKSVAASEPYKMSKTHFISNKIGWGLKLPGQNWQVNLPNQKKGLNKTIKNDLERSLDVEIDDQKLEELISFRKDSLNNFISFIELYKSSSEKDYEQMLTSLHDFFKAGYVVRNIAATYEMGASRIGGQMVDWFVIKEPQEVAGKKPLTVQLYNCLVGNYLLNIVVCSDNDTDRETLESIVNSSKFSSQD